MDNDMDDTGSIHNLLRKLLLPERAKLRIKDAQIPYTGGDINENKM